MRPRARNSPNKWDWVSSSAAAAIAADAIERLRSGHARVLMSHESWSTPRNISGALLAGHALTLQHADQPIGEAQPLGQHLDHIRQQRLAQRRLLPLDLFKCFGIEHVENARRFGLNGRAARAVSYEAHLADRGVSAQAAHAGGSAFSHVDDDADAALEDEMHGRGGIALAGDNLAGFDFQTLAIVGQAIGEMRVAKRRREP